MNRLKQNLFFFTLFEKALFSIWFIPLSMGLIALFASVLVFWINIKLGAFISHSIYNFDVAKTILVTCLSLTLAILSVSLSIIVSMLNANSSQVGPRLLKSIIKQQKVQLCLGFFVAAFVFSAASFLLIYWDPIYLPTLVVAILSLIFNAFLLIYLIEYVKQSIQVDAVFESLAMQIKKVIASCCTEKKPDTESLLKSNEHKGHIQALKTKKQIRVKSAKVGYIEAINYEKLFSLACDKDIFIELMYEPGDYIWPSLPIANVIFYKGDNPEFDAELLFACLSLGKSPLMKQDIYFCFDQLAEIIIRSLSPSPTNPYTACNAVDRIFDSLVYLLDYDLPLPSYEEESTNKIRLLIPSITYEKLIKSCFYRLSQDASEDILVAKRILTGIKKFLSMSNSNPLRQSLLEFSRDFHKETLKKITFQPALQELNEIYRAIETQLN